MTARAAASPARLFAQRRLPLGDHLPARDGRAGECAGVSAVQGLVEEERVGHEIVELVPVFQELTVSPAEVVDHPREGLDAPFVGVVEQDDATALAVVPLAHREHAAEHAHHLVGRAHLGVAGPEVPEHGRIAALGEEAVGPRRTGAARRPQQPAPPAQQLGEDRFGTTHLGVDLALEEERQL